MFSGKYLSKFITFDVDTKDNAEIDTRHLLNVLVNDFNICRDDIHVSLSGSKGYHVDIYFNKHISLSIIEKFYFDVLNRAGFSKNQVELRPRSNVGMKLPLGIHKVTGNQCWYVDSYTFKPIENVNHVLNIEPIDPDVFKTEYGDLEPVILTEKDSEQFTHLANTVNISTQEVEDCMSQINFVLENNHLRHPNTRNNMTLVLAMYLKQEGHTKTQAIGIIESIMLNTKKQHPKFIESSCARIMSQTKHVVTTVYKNDYKLKYRCKDVTITRDEILDILDIKEWHLKQLYLIHLIQSKQYAQDNGNYYITYQTMSLMGSTKNKTQLVKYIKQLELLDRVQVVARNVFDKERSSVEGKPMSKPNVYKIKKSLIKTWTAFRLKIAMIS
ncbi:TOTE conflict system archaeo-eukaryotic primase domain-containing protein [Staphylococcus hyicus]